MRLFRHQTIGEKSKMSLLLQRTSLTGLFLLTHAELFVVFVIILSCNVNSLLCSGILFAPFSLLVSPLSLFWSHCYSSCTVILFLFFCLWVSGGDVTQTTGIRAQSSDCSEGFRPGNTHTVSLMYRPGLGSVLLLMHSLPHTALAALVSESLLAATASAVLVMPSCSILLPWHYALARREAFLQIVLVT